MLVAGGVGITLWMFVCQTVVSTFMDALLRRRATECLKIN
jgi:hypothetical protein